MRVLWRAGPRQEGRSVREWHHRDRGGRVAGAWQPRAARARAGAQRLSSLRFCFSSDFAIKQLHELLFYKPVLGSTAYVHLQTSQLLAHNCVALPPSARLHNLAFKCSLVMFMRVQLPGTSPELLNKFRDKKVDFAAHTQSEDGGAVFANLIGNLAFPLLLVGGLFLLSRRGGGGMGGPGGNNPMQVCL
jgi:hypothetical protein